MVRELYALNFFSRFIFSVLFFYFFIAFFIADLCVFNSLHCCAHNIRSVRSTMRRKRIPYVYLSIYISCIMCIIHIMVIPLLRLLFYFFDSTTVEGKKAHFSSSIVLIKHSTAAGVPYNIGIYPTLGKSNYLYRYVYRCQWSDAHSGPLKIRYVLLLLLLYAFVLNNNNMFSFCGRL